MWRFIQFIYNFGLLEFVLIFLLFVNVLTFFLYKLDKQKAIKNNRRISERTLIFFTLACGGIGAFLGMSIFRHKTKKLKFKVSTGIGLLIVSIPIIHVIHGLTLDRIVQYVEIDFHSESWPAELDGYRIAFMSDMHAITDKDMAAVVAELNERNLDLLLLGGDFADFWGTAPHYQGTVREISRTHTTDGIFGVEGNHDHYASLFAAKERYGMIPLDNSGMQIRQGFYLAGVQDLWNRSPNIAEATAGANDDDFILLVTHNPDVSMRQPTAGIDLIVSGHTHGGQITFFGYPFYLLRPGSITDYGTRFSRGFDYSADGVPVFSTNGVGVYYSWPRVFARPEVVIFTMYSE